MTIDGNTWEKLDPSKLEHLSCMGTVSFERLKEKIFGIKRITGL